ncbi:hypothetical protein EXS56_02065 [Candidatus Kaiserbacteria bacterium]|nr:hypothetical protein [Candidatus Kaiserbacteria bacterium]
MRLFLGSAVALALLLATTVVAAAQDSRTTTTLGVLEATVVVGGQPVEASVVFKRTGPVQNELAAFMDMLRVVAVVAAVSVELDRVQRETAGMTCYWRNTGKKAPCFPRAPVMTAESLR